MYSFGQKPLNVELFKHAWIIFWILGCWATCLKLMYTKAWTHWKSYGYDRETSNTRKVRQAKNKSQLAHWEAQLSHLTERHNKSHLLRQTGWSTMLTNLSSSNKTPENTVSSTVNRYHSHNHNFQEKQKSR